MYAIALHKMDLTFYEDDIIVFSLLYTCITVIFAMAVLSKFLTNEFRFGFRSVLSLLVLLIGEPFCHFIVEGYNGLIIFALGCVTIYFVLPAGHLEAKDKTIVVTGCDSGFGHALAKKLDSIGAHVIACCLYPERRGSLLLRQTCSERLHIIKLDITSDADIQTVHDYVKKETAHKGLWGLVNNAGVFYTAELEMTSDIIMKKVLDINLVGMTRLTRALLPHIRSAQGRIVNVSSIATFITLEGFGAYTMSKAAIDAYSTILRLEMKKFGVHVAVIKPSGFVTGNVDTDVIEQRAEETWNSLDPETQETYGRDYLDIFHKSFLSTSTTFQTDLTPVVRAMRSALLSRRPHNTYPCGTGTNLVAFFFPIIPGFIKNYFLKAVGVLSKSVKPTCLQ